MPSSIKLTEPLDILVEYGYLDEDKPYHKALNNAVMDFAENPDLGGEYNKHYVMLLQKEAKKELKLRRKKISASAFKKGGATGAAENIGKGMKANNTVSSLAVRQPGNLSKDVLDAPEQAQSSSVSSGLINAIKGIAESVDRIKESLIGQTDLQKDAAEDARRAGEEKEAKKRESGLEKLMGPVKGIGEKLLKPFKSVFESVMDFLKTIFMGRIAMSLFDWFTKPENLSKVQSLFKFIKDWWPVLLAGLIAFLPGLLGPAGLIIGTIALVTWASVKIVDAVKSIFGIGPSVEKEIKSGTSEFNKSLKNSEADIEKEYVSPKDRKNNVDNAENNKETSAQFSEVQSGAEQSQKDISKVSEKPQKMAKGGPVVSQNGGQVQGEKGVDRVPAMLTEGEFVMSRGAVQQYGVDALANMNAAAGGTNQPTVKQNSNVKNYYQGGSIVKNKSDTNLGFPIQGFSGGGSVSSKRENLRAQKQKLINQFKFGGTGSPITVVGMDGSETVLIPGTPEYGAFFNKTRSLFQSGGANKAQIADKVKEGQRIDPPSSSKPPQTIEGALKSAGGTSSYTPSETPARDIPSFDAATMRSQNKIRILGLTV